MPPEKKKQNWNRPREREVKNVFTPATENIHSRRVLNEQASWINGRGILLENINYSTFTLPTLPLDLEDFNILL